MSRTDKTRPAWVRSLDPSEVRVAVHHPDCDLGRIPCSIDDRPEQKRRRETRWYCEWYTKHNWWNEAPRWYTNITWHRPERAREFTELREAVKLANANELDDDFDFVNEQHRHRSAWYYW